MLKRSPATKRDINTTTDNLVYLIDIIHLDSPSQLETQPLYT